MVQLTPLKERPATPNYGPEDALVIFGELFDRGYANGLAEAAKKFNMRVFEGTVGRREKDNSLRPLNSDELATKKYEFINIPLEAGFDLYQDSKGQVACDQLQGIKLTAWKEARLDFEQLHRAREEGRQDFRKRTREFIQAVAEKLGPDFKGRLIFAHTMAGGVPRAKIVMPLMNRVFKGTGDRYLSSEEFWESDIGKFCSMSFDEVTADTYKVLIEESKDLRTSLAQKGGDTSYIAYGYHGTEVMIDGKIQWQTYSPYLQGWAKKKLEDHAVHAKETEGVKACVFNCPEILTNSSSIFQGVEIPLYPLLACLQSHSSPTSQATLESCRNRLKDDVTFEQIFELTDRFLTAPVVVEHCVFEKWPQHSSKEQMELLLESSETLRQMHKDPKQLITETLSEAVFRGTGSLMLKEAKDPRSAVLWLGHDIIAEELAKA